MDTARSASRRRISRKKRLLFAAAGMLVICMLTLLFVEGLFRVFPSLLPFELRVLTATENWVESLYAADSVLEHRAVPRFDSEIPHRECPHHVRTVSLPHMPPEWGFRTPPLDPERPVRAAVLGDSFAFGYGIAEEESLAGLLRADTPNDGQVVNLALANMTGTLHYELILDRFLEHYRPAEVIILHFENDYTDDAFFETWRRLAGQDAAIPYPDSRRLKQGDRPGPLVWMKRRSITASLLAIAVSKIAANGRRIEGMGAEYVPSQTVMQVVAPDNAEARRGCELGQAALERMFAMCRDTSAAVTVVMIPCKEQALAAEDELEESTQFYRETDAFCREQGACVVDLLEPFRQHVRTRQLYFVVDGHWTADGHAEAHRHLRSAIAARSGEVLRK